MLGSLILIKDTYTNTLFYIIHYYSTGILLTGRTFLLKIRKILISNQKDNKTEQCNEFQSDPRSVNKLE